MKPSDSEKIVVARFGRPHGIKGFVSVHSFTMPRDNIIEYAPWFIYLNKAWKEVKPLQLSFGSRQCLALIEGYETREKAAMLTNRDIAVFRHVLPELPEGEYYWYELVGMQVVNATGSFLGQVDSLLETGGHDVLILEHQGQQRMIPYVPQRIVLQVDKQAGKMIVDWEE